MNEPDRPGENRDEEPGTPQESMAETLAKLEATMNELVALVERHFARRD